METTSKTDLMNGKPPRPRRWVPVSLRMFLAVLVLLALGGALWIGVTAYQQHMAIREIERLGGRIITEPRGPVWLRDLVGKKGMRSFDIVVSVDLANAAATDATLSRVTCLTGLKYIRLTKTQVTDAGLANLKRLTSLREVGLYRTQVTDAGLVHLKGLPELWRLNLGKTKVTETGVAELQQALPHLEFLDW